MATFNQLLPVVGRTGCFIGCEHDISRFGGSSLRPVGTSHLTFLVRGSSFNYARIRLTTVLLTHTLFLTLRSFEVASICAGAARRER